MVFALMDYQSGIDSFIGMTFFQPILAAIFAIITIIACGILGLPIRLNKKIKKWWTTHFYISIMGTVCGLTLLGISLMPYSTETIKTQIEGAEIMKEIPNSILVLTGWFLTAFSTLHLYPPNNLKRKIENIFTKIAG
jgi:hypothetical protein